MNNAGSLAVPAIVLVAGLIAWGMSNNSKVSEAGRIAYFVGLLCLVAMLSRHMVQLP
jgi:hypothetical protein